MATTNTDLQKKIEMLQLCLVDDRVYQEHLKAYEELGIYTERFEYYKMYGQCFVPYSKEYVMRSTIEELLKRDKEKHIQCSSSLFNRLKRKMGVWIWRGKMKSLGGLAEWVQKYSKDEKR
ncbi:hypothetical protein [Bacillus toyonensis]|uniref:hypothetical protein n=1 Tax=Bacillus toyonensis TaxID=155322 RepID=UPI000BFE7BB7|nr:hypothetical protein [Bacillus toyonensis]PHG63757.1 hypothetical protein COI59_17880 [Bacillus toyonensis]